MTRGALLFICFLVVADVSGQLRLNKTFALTRNNLTQGYVGFQQRFGNNSPAVNLSPAANLKLLAWKDEPELAFSIFPVLSDYRYSLNKTGKGFYIEPQVGYELYGADPDSEYTGLVIAGGAGYVFPAARKGQIDLGILFETPVQAAATAKFLSLRFTQHLVFRTRQ